MLDRNGEVKISNRPPIIGRNFKERDYFKDAQIGNEAGKLYVTPPFQSVLNTYVMNVSCVIHGAHGEFSGVLAATLDPDYFKTLLESVMYAPDMWTYIAHGDGKLFMSVPELSSHAGKEIDATGSMFRQHMESNADESILTGVFRLTDKKGMVALRRVHPQLAHMSKPLIVAVHRNADDIFAEWRRDRMIRLSGFLLTVLITISFLRIYQARVKLSYEQELLSRRALKDSENKYRSIFENVQEVVYQTDMAGVILDISPSVNRYLGMTRESMIGRRVTDYYADPSDRTALLDELSKAAEVRDYELVLKDNNDDIVYISLNAHFLLDGAGRKIGVEGAWRDITERKHLEELLESLAFIDALTHLPNRRRFEEVIELEFRRAQRDNIPISLIMLDIDHFKAYNDNYGHGTGDHCLQQVSKAMFECMTRAGDLLARYGGEEFVVLLPNTDMEGAMHVAEKLRAKIEAIKIPHEYSGLASYVTISAGCATAYPENIKTVDAKMLIAEADVMLYEAKNSGRNRVCA